MVTLLCTVRGCRAGLRRQARTLVCERGHGFDIARSGYVNLLQAQDRRSRRAGDSAEVLAARRRILDLGIAAPLVDALGERVRGPLATRVAAAAGGKDASAASPALLDVGCGDGFFLRALVTGREEAIEAHGLDLSVAAVEAAARAQPAATFVVANADRGLPYARRSFAVVLSLTSRLHPEEMRRVLEPDGLLVVAVPGPDDLVELREAALGKGTERDRMARVRAELAGTFEELGAAPIRHRLRLEPDRLRDALAATYRGARRSVEAKAAALAAMEVTASWDLAWFRRAAERSKDAAP